MARRTPQEDIALITVAGAWGGRRDPVLNGTVLLFMYGKRRHWPLRNLHQLAKAYEKGDMEKADKFYRRLEKEVTFQLRLYPDIRETVEMTSELSDETFAAVDRYMQEHGQELKLAG